MFMLEEIIVNVLNVWGICIAICFVEDWIGMVLINFVTLVVLIIKGKVAYCKSMRKGKKFGAAFTLNCTQ